LGWKGGEKTEVQGMDVAEKARERSQSARREKVWRLIKINGWPRPPTVYRGRRN